MLLRLVSRLTRPDGDTLALQLAYGVKRGGRMRMPDIPANENESDVRAVQAGEG